MESPSMLRIVGDAGETEARQRDICGICSVQFARYTCPKCHVRYCSGKCYKDEKHAHCSEQFYKDCLMEELRSRGEEGNKEEKMRMIEILKRMKEEEEEEEDGCDKDGPTLEERLAGISLDDDADTLWQALTSKEREQFHKMLQSGALGRLVDTHTPWWETFSQKVHFIDEESTVSSSSSLPPLPLDVPPLGSLVKGGVVSPCVAHNIINILYSYAYTVRLYNCGHHDIPAQSAKTLLTISAVLCQDLSFATTQDALQHAMGAILSNTDIFNSLSYSSSVLKDVSSLLARGPAMSGHILAQHVLADVHRLFERGRMDLKSKKIDDTDIEWLSRRLWLGKKKLMFLISWTAERGESELLGLEKIVMAEYEAKQREIQQQIAGEQQVFRPPLSSSTAQMKQTGAHNDCQQGGHEPLIEELN